MIIGFHSNQLDIRGSGIAIHDYAKYNMEILGNQSIVITCDHQSIDNRGLFLFQNGFQMRFYNDPLNRNGTATKDIDKIVREEKIDILYFVKAGADDGILSIGCRNVVHCVFVMNTPHGDVYAAVSEWLSKQYDYKFPFVPHIININEYWEKYKDNLSITRESLSIPKNNIVFGRYGGEEEFNIPFVYKTISKILKKRKDIYFIFMNTNKFISHDHVLFFEPTFSMRDKVSFINVCDAMIHARSRGETFGFAIGEFSAMGKPIITWTGSKEKAHIDILGSKGIYYNNKRDLYKILYNFQDHLHNTDYNVYGKIYTPQNVMKKFEEVFIR